jgi:hypothetical protein
MRIFDCNKWQLRGFLANNIKILKVHLSEHCDVYLKKAYNVLRFTVRCSNEESFDMISFLILTIFTRFLKKLWLLSGFWGDTGFCEVTLNSGTRLSSLKSNWLLLSMDLFWINKHFNIINQ